MIPVTKPYLPKKGKLKKYIDRIYKSGYLTNNGPLVKELESGLREFLGVKHLILVANGSLALQVAFKALGLKGEVITTPFSFVATTSTLVWEGLDPVFADIDPQSFNLDPKTIEPLINKKTSAILPVHVYGNPCEVEAIQKIAEKHKLKVIYDAAHAFGVNYKEESVLNYGDISTLSFHATKVFHTIEGGAIITKDDTLARKVRQLINFGITGPESIEGIGTNAKMNEFEAAMGLCVLKDMKNVQKKRKTIGETYFSHLKDLFSFQKWNSQGTRNYAYAPVLVESEEKLLKIQENLQKAGIIPRRYFYPSLDTLSYLGKSRENSISVDIASRILCFPIYADLKKKDVERICNIVKKEDK